MPSVTLPPTHCHFVNSLILGSLMQLVDPVTGKLKPQSDGPLHVYSNTVISTLAVDVWAVNLVQRGGAWASCGLAHSSLYQM